MQPTLEHVGAREGVLEVERLRARRWLNRPKPERAERDEHGADRADLLEPGERRLHRDRRRLLVLDDLAEHVLLLELAARRLLHEERERARRATTGMPRMNQAQRQPSAPPAHVAIAATSTGLASPMPCAAHVHDRRHPGADADRVVVGDQRLVHRDAVRLGDAGREARPEQHERARPRARTGTRRSRTARLAHADDRHALARGRRASPSGPRRARRTPPTRCAMNTIAPSLMPNVSRISGASTLIAAPSSSSSELSSVSTTNIIAPPPANPSRNETGSELTPGSRSSGKMTCSRARLCAASRASSSSRTVAASARHHRSPSPPPPCPPLLARPGSYGAPDTRVRTAHRGACRPSDTVSAENRETAAFASFTSRPRVERWSSVRKLSVMSGSSSSRAR